jgi:PAS domain-containing protein
MDDVANAPGQKPRGPRSCGKGFAPSSGERACFDHLDAYRGLLEAAPDAMLVVDQDGKIVLLNVQAEKQFGYFRDELIGQPDLPPIYFDRRKMRWRSTSGRGSSSLLTAGMAAPFRLRSC